MDNVSAQEASTMQVIVRHTEICERCGAINPFRKQTTIKHGDYKMWYAKCVRCGASAKVYWTT